MGSTPLRGHPGARAKVCGHGRHIERIEPMTKLAFDADFRVDVRPEEIVVRVPHAMIVGIEEQHVDVLALENGLWNRITGADLEKELAQLPEMARTQALETDLPAEAEQELQHQLDKRIHSRQPLKLVFTDAAPVESPAVNR